jgi:hypothetical protein
VWRELNLGNLGGKPLTLEPVLLAQRPGPLARRRPLHLFRTRLLFLSLPAFVALFLSNGVSVGHRCHPTVDLGLDRRLARRLIGRCRLIGSGAGGCGGFSLASHHLAALHLGPLSHLAPLPPALLFSFGLAPLQPSPLLLFAVKRFQPLLPSPLLGLFGKLLFLLGDPLPLVCFGLLRCMSVGVGVSA